MEIDDGVAFEVLKVKKTTFYILLELVKVRDQILTSEQQQKVKKKEHRV